jgi:hypothetical protein
MIKYASIHKLELAFVARAPSVLINQPLIGEGFLRVVISPPQPRVTGKAIEVPPVLLDVLAVVTLRTSEPEHALLQDGVDPVPQRNSETQFMVYV